MFFFFYLYILMTHALILHFLHLRIWFSSHLSNSAALKTKLHTKFKNSYKLLFYLLFHLFLLIQSIISKNVSSQNLFKLGQVYFGWWWITHLGQYVISKTYSRVYFVTTYLKKGMKYIEYIWILFKSIIERIHPSCFKNQLYLFERNLCLQQLKFYYTEIRFRKTARRF